MKVLIVHAHPEPQSSNHTLVAEAALEGKLTEFYGVPVKLPP